MAKALSGGEDSAPGLHWRIALHEAGHAAVGIRLGLDITRITATPARGQVLWHERQSEGLIEDYAAAIALQLAGRAAEELFLSAPSAGAGGDERSDLAQATRLATDLELRSGLGSTGLMWWEEPQRMLPLHPRVQAKVAAHLETGRQTAISMIRRMPHLVQGLAEVLIREGEISGAALEGWTHTIRTFDPEVTDQPSARIVVFPGRSSILRNDEAVPPQPSA